MRSHERGYPALLDISDQPVGALVLAKNSLAGDIWTADRRRRSISETVVVGRNLHRVYPEPPAPPPKADPTYDRLVRWFGERGRDLLATMKIGVVGAGGVGLPVVTMLSRLGVGELVVIDPDRIDPTNLPRMPEARRLDALMPLRRIPGGAPLADRLSTRKIRLARRAARRANPKIRFKGFPTNVVEPRAAFELVDCDYIFLAADGHLARMLVNAVAHQFLIPAVQLGTRIDVDRNSGAVGDIRTNVRPILPGSGCLRCNGLISAAKLQEEATAPRERERNRIRGGNSRPERDHVQHLGSLAGSVRLPAQRRRIPGTSSADRLSAIAAATAQGRAGQTSRQQATMPRLRIRIE